MRIVFMGTPEFAVRSLQKLAASPHQIACVVTQPDRPCGRGRLMTSPPVKKEARILRLPVLQPEELTDRIFLRQLSEYQADCFAVVAFRILPEAVFKMPPKGSVNLHASLLPKYRGAAPIQWALILGERQTGVTTFFIRKKVDTGEWIQQEIVPIAENETAGELQNRLAVIGADVLLRTMDMIESGTVKSMPQCGESTNAPKLQAEHGAIEWDKSAFEIHNWIRGLSPRPGAFAMLNRRRLKIYRSRIEAETGDSGSPPGTVIQCCHNHLIVQTGKGCLRLLEVQLEGKGRMGVAEFVCGRSVAAGNRLANGSHHQKAN